MGKFWELFKKGFVYLALLECNTNAGASEAFEFDTDSRRSISQDDSPPNYLPPAAHNAWGQLADYSLPDDTFD